MLHLWSKGLFSNLHVEKGVGGWHHHAHLVSLVKTFTNFAFLCTRESIACKIPQIPSLGSVLWCYILRYSISAHTITLMHTVSLFSYIVLHLFQHADGNGPLLLEAVPSSVSCLSTAIWRRMCIMFNLYSRYSWYLIIECWDPLCTHFVHIQQEIRGPR